LENLTQKLIPQEQRDLKYSTKLPWGERNLEVLTKVAQGKGVGMPWGDSVFHQENGLGCPVETWLGGGEGD